ncbi:hypothetical protein LJC17_00390 [Acholeplasma sp. OttesenSCG-928-E16]|nr:hypothetical protein [Acholeplasma sp. OttesenSCG-928-E16]
MDIIFYNPLSKNGKTLDTVNELIRKLNVKREKISIYSLLEIENIDDFLKTIDPTDRLIFVGGDGTLHRLANAIYDKNIKNKLFVYKAGTGNDFLRSLKKKKEYLVDATEYLKKLPEVTINGNKHYFLNGVGIGIDGLICYMVNTSKEEKNAINYFKNTVRAFFKTKKIKKVKVNIDGNDIEFKNVWFCSVLNDKYMGGGMKFAPKANRNNSDLYLVTIKSVPKWLLPLLLPSIYLGWHVIFKGFVKVIRIKKNIKIEFDRDSYLQMDGEVEYPVTKIDVKPFQK